MIGIIVAVVVVAGAAIGIGKHEGALDKRSETTYQDTVAFEKEAALKSLEYAERLENKQIEKEKISEEKRNDTPPAAPIENTDTSVL